MPLTNLHHSRHMGSHLETLHTELLQLGAQYGKQLKDEAIQSDVECLTTWIEAYQQGSREAAEYLQEYGMPLLENIHTRLKEATTDLQRMDGESPAPKSTIGESAHRISRATAIASRAEEEMEAAINEEIKYNH